MWLADCWFGCFSDFVSWRVLDLFRLACFFAGLVFCAAFVVGVFGLVAWCRLVVGGFSVLGGLAIWFGC